MSGFWLSQMMTWVIDVRCVGTLWTGNILYIESDSLNDWVPDTPYQARSYCPLCEPEADPIKEILEVRWCELHTPSRSGSADDYIRSNAYLSGSAEAEGADNKRWCDAIHRGIEAPLDPPTPSLTTEEQGLGDSDSESTVVF